MAIIKNRVLFAFICLAVMVIAQDPTINQGLDHDNGLTQALGADHSHDHSHDPGQAHSTGHAHAHGLAEVSSNGTDPAQSMDSQSGHSHASSSCSAEEIENFNLGMRVGSIFIILATSAVGIFAPILMHRINTYSKGDIRDWVLTVGKFFGTGVILATAFIHMLPEALEKFDSPCLSDGWHSYHAFGGVFCLIASFALQLLELAAISHLDSLAKKNTDNKATDVDAEKRMAMGQEHTHDNVEHNHVGFDADGHVHSAGFLENEQSLRNIGTLILELGIVMHSIIIGITLGTTGDSEFTTLLIALVFHQFFEGVALGTRINDLNCKSWTKPIVMGLLFICMTPIGVAIGVGIHNSMDVPSSILAQAILDSLSAGILLYNAYVSLMSIEINHNAGFRRSPLKRKVVCFVSMYVGAALMAVLGTWA